MQFRFFTTLAVCALLLPLAGADADEKSPAKKDDSKSGPSPFKTQKERFSYAIGMNIGSRTLQSLTQQGVEVDAKKAAGVFTLSKRLIENIGTSGLDIDPQALADGFNASITKADPKLNEKQIGETFAEIQKVIQAKRAEVQKKQAEEQKALAEKNEKSGAAFLKEHGAKSGVKTTKSGLQYQVLKPGKGDKPKDSDTVKVHYHGTLIDGTVFDSSVKRGQPATFPVGGVIAGWTEALQLMPVGSKWKLVIPSKLAYQDRGAGRLIGPHAVLVFEVELLEIVKTK